MELRIGISLLERTAKSVSLAEAGRLFLDEARALLERGDEAMRKVRAIATAIDTELHVGYSPTPTALPLILRAFQRAMPNARVKLPSITYCALASPELPIPICRGQPQPQC